MVTNVVRKLAITPLRCLIENPIFHFWWYLLFKYFSAIKRNPLTHFNLLFDRSWIQKSKDIYNAKFLHQCLHYKWKHTTLMKGGAVTMGGFCSKFLWRCYTPLNKRYLYIWRETYISYTGQNRSNPI